MRERFVARRFGQAAHEVIDNANAIIAEYVKGGLVLTLRQLYYQFVARGLLPNKQTEYKRLGSIVNDARLAGLIDWGAIEDRTRNLASRPHWDSPKDLLKVAAAQYRVDKWETQPTRVEVWIEKEALAGVIAGVCEKHDVPYFACRGYGSQSELYSAGKRFRRYAEQGQRVLVVHLGDHDPSGIDMTRDNEERLRLFMEDYADALALERVALNGDQIRKYRPPPNPVKLTDSRSDAYRRDYGDESWELDALDPGLIGRLITVEVDGVRDELAWALALTRERSGRERLRNLAVTWKENG